MKGLMRCANVSKSQRLQKGASMIETLVAFTLLAFGVMGLTKMQTVAVVQIDDSRQDLVALWKLQDLVDRIVATRTEDNPEGLAALYQTAIGGNFSEIGDDDNTQVFACPDVPDKSCARRTEADNSVTSAEVCTNAELVEHDVWETFCDPNVGLVSTGADATGSVSLQEMQVAMVAGDTVVVDPADGSNVTTREYVLYLEWVSGSSDNNAQLLNPITTNVCGTTVDVDPGLSVYCLRFR